MTYARRPGQSAVDMAAAQKFENEVRQVLPDTVVVRTESSVDLDFYIPFILVEVKEKRQPLTQRWWNGLLPSAEPDLFVIDELTVRKALKHWPYVWFVLRDVPGNRLFLASISDVLSADRHRFDRNGKGKWVLDLSGLREIYSLESIMDAIRQDIEMEDWKSSHCVVRAPEV